jgi:hypothetical protein
VIESRFGKYAVVACCATLALVLATSRPRKPRIVYPMAAVAGLAGLLVAIRVRPAPAVPPTQPLGDPQAFIDAVPAHVASLRRWCQDLGLPVPPDSRDEWDQWVFTNREPLGSHWPTTALWLVAAYGEILRSADPQLRWEAGGLEPVLAGRWLRRGLFIEVHDAVFVSV